MEYAAAYYAISIAGSFSLHLSIVHTDNSINIYFIELIVYICLFGTKPQNPTAISTIDRILSDGFVGIWTYRISHIACVERESTLVLCLCDERTYKCKYSMYRMI